MDFPERTVTEITVSELHQNGFGCPMRWSGVLEDGNDIHFRYRWGFWEIYTGEVSVFSRDRHHIVTGHSDRGEYDGICDWEEFHGWALQEGYLIRVLSWNHEEGR